MIWLRITSILKWLAGIVGAALAGIITNYIWALVDPGSKPADIVRDHYPPVLAKLVRPAQGEPLQQGVPAAGVAPPAPIEMPAPAKAEPPKGELVVATPASEPLSARVLAPIRTDERMIRITLLLSSTIDAQKVFVLQNGQLADWSARVVESGAVCVANTTQLSGLKSFWGDSWKEPGVDLDQLPAGIASQVDVTFNCDKQVSAGETMLFKARFDIVTGLQRSPVTFTSSALRIAERR